MDLGHDNLVKRQLYREVSETMPIEALEDRYGHLFPSEDSAIVRSACRDVQTFAGHASLQVTIWREPCLFSRCSTCSRRRERFANKGPSPMCHPCDMDAPAQDDTRREGLDFIGIR
jgi:hypothetical protein